MIAICHCNVCLRAYWTAHLIRDRALDKAVGWFVILPGSLFQDFMTCVITQTTITSFQYRICGVSNVLHNYLTHWGRDKMAAVSQTTLSNSFSWMKMLKFRWRFHSNLFLGVQLTISVQIMAWRRSGDKPLYETMMVSLLTHLCITRPQWDKPQLHDINIVFMGYLMQNTGTQYISSIACFNYLTMERQWQ